MIVVFAFSVVRPARAGEIVHVVRLPAEGVTVDRASGFSRVTAGDEQFEEWAEPGRPVVPFRIVSVLLPQGEGFAGVISATSRARILGAYDQPLLGEPPTTLDGVIGRAQPIFNSPVEAAYPPVAVKYMGTGFLHGWAIASFAVFPLRVEDGALFLCETVTLRVSTTRDGAHPAATRKRHDSGADDRERALLRSIVVNPEAADGYAFDRAAVAKPKGGFAPTSYPSLEGSPVDYLIITNTSLAPEYQRLADWKTAKGVPTVVRTIEWITANARNGVDLAETLRLFIRDAYEKWGIEFVLLGGDSDVIPARYGVSRYIGTTEEIATDLYFSCLDGSWNEDHDQFWGESGATADDPDLYPEVFVGRLPASNVADAATIVDKVIAYETPVEADHLDKIYLGAEVLFPPDWKPGVPINFNGADIADFLYYYAFAGKPLDTTRAYETSTNSGWIPFTRQSTLDSMQAGFNVVAHIGHGSRFNFSCGDASLVQPDADALTNGNRLFLLYMIDCKVSQFDYQCIAENFLTNASGGAVATIGASHLEFPSADSYYMYEFFDLSFTHGMVRLGETLAGSRLPRTPIALIGDGVDLWTHYVTTLLGDPEMPLFTGSVGTVNVVHVPSVGLGTTDILVNVTSGGQPVDSAVVCLTKGGDDYQYGATNALGNVTFPFTAETAGVIDVVVTGRNLARHEGSITVNAAAGAYVNYASLTVDDNTSGGSFGNADGAVDAGETIDMTISLKNTGGASTGTVSLVLRSSSAGVTIPDSTANVGTIGVGVTKAATDPVRVVLDKNIVDETAVEFRLVIKEAAVVKWNDRFRKEVHAPELELTTLRIFDGAPLGNGNGVNEAGEQFRLYYGLKNYGTGLASGLSATLKDLDGMFVFYDSTDTYANLGSFVEGENVDGFHIKETNVSAEHDLEVTVTDLFTRVYRDTIELRVPLPPTGLVLDAGFGIDRIKLMWSKSVSPDAVRYCVYRSLVSGGPYGQVSADPVEHPLFMDTGLPPSTRYYYVVTSVDGSGNESAKSVEGTASTNPPQLAGWPIETMGTSSGAPAVGDIDGDGDLEVVAGSTLIYAWHHDGMELRDGDGDPQSWGVLNTEGTTFTAAVGLAHLDNTPGLDIMAADLVTKKVYCFAYTGDLLPGWPRPGEMDFRAAPVAGDLDGDGFYEVIAVDTRGAIYAWRSNGAEYRDGDGNPATNGIFYRTPAATFHYQTPSVCDIDGDFCDEIILGTRSDSIYVLNGDGTRVPGWPFKMAGEAAGSAAVGDVDGDGDLEIVAQSKGSYGKVYLLHHNGTVEAGWPKTVRLIDIYFTSSPGLADFDGDGKLEIFAYGWDASQSKVYVFTRTGANYPGWPIVASNYYSEASLVAGDLDGDGTPELVFGDESRLVHAFDVNGHEIDGFPVTTQEAVRATPFICDLDRDGGTDLLVYGWDRSVYVWNLNGVFAGSEASWPTFQGNVHRNGRIGFEVPTAVDGPPEDRLPATAALLQNYPNPFNPTTRLVFDVPRGRPQLVTLRIYDIAGALVRTLVDETLPPGRHTREWDGRDDRGNLAGTGVYFCQLREPGVVSTKKTVLLK